VRQPPQWYSGSNITSFDAGSFTGRMSALSSSAGSAMCHPRGARVDLGSAGRIIGWRWWWRGRGRVLGS
jgi:hypothetical protein